MKAASVLSSVLLFSIAAVRIARADEGQFKVESNLRASVAKVDITPPPDTPVDGHIRPTHGARDPLHAAILLLDDSRTKAAIITLDLLEAWPELVQDLREQLAHTTGIPQHHILVAAAHNHSGPLWTRESGWGHEAVAKISTAAASAAKELRPVTVGYGEDRIDFNINRRKVINGRAVVRLNSEGPCDHRVKVLRFDDGRSLAPLAALLHAVCHPCVFTWGDQLTPPYPKGFPKMSADFPGEAQTFVEAVYGNKTKSLFLQGCAGDIRPNLPGFPYRCGDEADIQWAGRSLGCAAVRVLSACAIREQLAKRPTLYQIKVAHVVVMLPGKKAPVRAELQALKIGPYLLLTMPGEPFVEYGFKLEKAIADRAVLLVVGYANGSIGYIPTAQAHAEGGYEPNNSPLVAASEAVLLKELNRLADRVLSDVFDSFAPKDAKANR
jgi:hypothetical protein